MAERPRQFGIYYGHPFANRLVFGGLGRHANSAHYHDSSLDRNHGALTSMDPATDWLWVSELGRWALVFDGSDDYISASSGTFNCAYPFSLAAWMCCDVDNSQSQATVLSVGTDSTHMFLVGWNTYSTNSQAILAGWNTTNDPLLGSKVLTLSTWHHVTGIFESATNRRLIVDGASDGNDTSSVTEYTSGTIIRVGCRPTTGYNFPGKISDPIVFNRVLSTAETSELADPSNVLLSGLIVPQPSRRLWAGYVAVAGGYTVPLSHILECSA